jgi:NAD(P)-dependent dehydrogenase (short-subunit alcohol dehydrogenase family)
MLEGMTVYLGCRDETRGLQAERELAATVGGGDARFVALDVTDVEQIEAAVRRIDAECGRLDVLVNNAGIVVEWGTGVEDATAEQMRRTYDVNVFGVVAVTRACIPLLRRSAAGRVVNLTSPLGSLTMISDPGTDVSRVGLLAYSSSKTALNAITALYANALREAGIRVNAVNPGFVATDLNGHRGDRTPEEGAEAPVRLALLGADDPTGAFLGGDDGSVAEPLPW